MNTPILTKQQQKHSLSAKKTSAKGLRNVLAQPQDSYWPSVSTDKYPDLESLLTNLTTAIKRTHHDLPWSKLRHMKKEERALAKKEALSKEGNVLNTEIINSVILGLNAITRSLEKSNVCCVLMDAHIEPQFLIRHIIIMAQNKKVPILLLPNLKTITLNSIGFASAAFALKNIVMVSPDHHFYPLYSKIHDISKDIPLPKNSLQLFKDEETLEESTLNTEDKISIENVSQTESSEPIKFILSTNVYKYRSSCKQRAFIPLNAARGSSNEPVVDKVEQNDFISLSNYNSDEYDASIRKNTRYINIHKDKYRNKRDYSKVNKTSTNVTYLPLKVKRLQGNNNRVKATKASVKQKKR
ncbi:uncharacterized protein LOC128891652 [Hylaeus anthracinus]|uniref:uncharacterized protein LOC128881243 n=1 Tax=Hylaeus volcanicus TaxID=313075 RepID=UPI0023B7ECA3|nr:uncharacterized protein LOC128881243 [Hylaeus volcanicus]XP_054007284.1 uncharacterized protein LOC128891652 [Hylaeus anthracinus]